MGKNRKRNNQTYTSKSGRQYQIKGGYWTGYSVFDKATNDYLFGGFDDPEEAKRYIELKEKQDEKPIDYNALGIL